MQPTFKNGETVLVSSVPYMFVRPKVGDIVVFYHKTMKKNMIKRIKKIKNRRYFVMGDNKDDSKRMGWITRKQIVGRVIRN